jgi:hypothetical protein
MGATEEPCDLRAGVGVEAVDELLAPARVGEDLEIEGATGRVLDFELASDPGAVAVTGW